MNKPEFVPHRMEIVIKVEREIGQAEWEILRNPKKDHTEAIHWVFPELKSFPNVCCANIECALPESKEDLL